MSAREKKPPKSSKIEKIDLFREREKRERSHGAQNTQTMCRNGHKIIRAAKIYSKSKPVKGPQKERERG